MNQIVNRKKRWEKEKERGIMREKETFLFLTSQQNAFQQFFLHSSLQRDILETTSTLTQLYLLPYLDQNDNDYLRGWRMRRLTILYIIFFYIYEKFFFYLVVVCQPDGDIKKKHIMRITSWRMACYLYCSFPTLLFFFYENFILKNIEKFFSYAEIL